MCLFQLVFLKYLKAAKVNLNEYDFPANKVSNVQPALEKLVSRKRFLPKIRFAVVRHVDLFVY